LEDYGNHHSYNSEFETTIHRGNSEDSFSGDCLSLDVNLGDIPVSESNGQNHYGHNKNHNSNIFEGQRSINEPMTVGNIGRRNSKSSMSNDSLKDHDVAIVKYELIKFNYSIQTDLIFFRTTHMANFYYKKSLPDNEDEEEES
jgi:hypothetical protein